ncbi:MAG TPA: PASTA domain-containing protein [Candidatus Polarisedimenticolia bacterium]|jgi:serine/threonine-protein kinase|nr:PASTA domain-containing protein [Candidatus Polarisedimenticolia bacterium]
MLSFVTRWAALGLALIGAALLSGYLSMRKAVRGGEVSVPALANLTVSEAASRLKENGLILERSGERTDPLVPAGSIVSQDPAEGSRLKRNRKVRVLLSLGREVLAVPELVGQPARRAQIGLQQSGLKIGQLAYVSSDRSEADRILAQEPPAGSQRMREGEVDLLISKGSRPKTWVMPRVEGVDLGTATRLFNQAGLRVTNVRREVPPEGVSPGIILQQVPLAGYPLKEGDSISLVVSAGAEDHE